MPELFGHFGGNFPDPKPSFGVTHRRVGGYILPRMRLFFCRPSVWINKKPLPITGVYHVDRSGGVFLCGIDSP